MEEITVKLSIEDRIERFAISYAEHHYDVKSMSLTDYLKTVNQIENELAKIMGK
ncbi:MAG: hypothetical protein IJL78_08265 [Lachnospiraceae bacterium]|nr:hypothetical protein [Lachnospiraceae bacterium]